MCQSPSRPEVRRKHKHIKTEYMKTETALLRQFNRISKKVGRVGIIPGYSSTTEFNLWKASRRGESHRYEMGYLQRARSAAKQKSDPLTLTQAQRVQGLNPLQVLGRLRKDAPGLLVGFEVEASGVDYTTVNASGPLPRLAPRAQMEHCGVEIPVLCRMDNLKPLYAVCRRLKDLGGKVTKECGGHVHLDVRDMFSGSTQRGRQKYPAALKASVTRLALVVEKVFRFAVPPSRVGNRFCVLGGLDWTGNDRYRAVNCASLSKHRTIEVRLGAASLNPDKWRIWASCLVWALRHPISKGDLASAELVRDAVGAMDWVMRSALPPVEKWWLVCRIRKFHPSAMPKLDAGSLETEGGEY
jgi:hypothetical protein